MEVELPGGLVKGECVERLVRFRPLTGRIEQRLIELSGSAKSDRPTHVTAVLDSVLESIGNQPLHKDTVANLCVADRQFLMMRLATYLDGEQMWLKVTCARCHAFFDVEIQRCELPVKPSGESFPWVKVTVNGHVIDARIPTGSDQENIGQLSEEEAMRRLLETCISTVDGEPPNQDILESFTESEFNAIDLALDEVSPAVCDQLLVTCPECGMEQRTQLDHYELNGMNENYFYDEVHSLASHYHWSESAILDLPQDRRRLYLNLINRSAGMTGNG